MAPDLHSNATASFVYRWAIVSAPALAVSSMCSVTQVQVLSLDWHQQVSWHAENVCKCNSVQALSILGDYAFMSNVDH